MSLHPLRNAEPAEAGAWKLPAGRAITLAPRQPGRLRIARGAVWATLDGPHAVHPDSTGDRVLACGESLALRAGQRLVMEPLEAGQPAWFRWDLTPASSRVAAAQALAQPWAQLCRGVALTLQALALLGAGLGRLALQALRPARAAPAPACCGEGLPG